VDFKNIRGYFLSGYRRVNGQVTGGFFFSGLGTDIILSVSDPTRCHP